MKTPIKRKKPVLEIPILKVPIAPLTMRLDREDHNLLVDKINEIIATINHV